MPPTVTEPDDQEPIVILDDGEDVVRLLALSMITRLTTYAQGRLVAGIGIDRFKACGLLVPGFIDIYRPGFIPQGYRAVLSPDETAILGDVDLSDCCVVPAFDQRGTMVDLLCWHLGASPSFICSLQQAPFGVMAPRIAGIASDILIVDDLAVLCQRLATGERHVHLLRPDVPVKAQVRELAMRGVRSVRLATVSAAVAEACAVVGMTVLDDTSASDWRLVEFSRDHHRAVFQSGDLVVSVKTPCRGSTMLHVDARRGDGRHQDDDFDIVIPRRVQVFAELAARKLQVDAAPLLALLGDGLLDRLRALEEGSGAEVARPLPAAAVDTDALLAGHDIMSRFARDAEALGWIGDTQAKTLAALTIAGLGLDHPPWLLLRGPSAITMPVVGMLADLLPAERRLHLNRAAESSLPNQGPDGLRHRMLVIDDLAAIRAATLTTLRVLQARGGVAVPVATRNAETGRMQSRLTEARGPAGMIAAASEATDGDDLGVVVRLDESPAQTANAMAVARHLFQDGVDEQARNRTRARWQGIMAALPRIAVRVPSADRVVFPARHPRHRVEQGWFFALVEASALLHHRQRPQVDGHLVATDEDIQLVIAATRGLLGRMDDDLSDRARQLRAGDAGVDGGHF